MKKFLAIILVAFCLLSAVMPISAAAESNASSSVLTRDQVKTTGVLEDLSGLSIRGKKFDVKDYPARKDGTLQMLTLAEFNYVEDKATNYLVCVYVYNPAKAKLVTDSSENAIELATVFEKNGDDLNATKFAKMRLEFCNKSDDGLFYKYAIKDANNLLYQSMKKCSQVSGGVRRYYVSGIELLTQGASNAFDTKVAWHWDYAGYAQTTAGGISTLTMSEGDSKVIHLDLGSTYFRPEGTIDKQGAVYSQINTVYFAVSNSDLEKYGEMSAVHFNAWIYDTAPIYVLNTNDKLAKAAYDHLKQYIGNQVDAPDKTVKYQLYAYNPLTNTTGRPHDYYWVYNDDGVAGAELYASQDAIYWLFESNAPDKLVLSGDDLKYYAETYAEKYVKNHPEKVPFTEEQFIEMKKSLSEMLSSWISQGFISEQDDAYKSVKNYLDTTDYMIGGKYPCWLFVMPDVKTALAGFNDFSVSVDDEKINLSSIKRTEKSFWRRGSDKYENLSDAYKNINLIEAVAVEDLKLSQADFCRKYFIAEEDYAVFSDYVSDANQNDETVYVVRHTVSEYTAYGLFTDEYGTPTGFKANEGSCASQQTVFLDMDVIDLTFTKDEVNTVIPCVATPIDVFNSVTRHENQEVGDKGLPRWATVLIIAAIVLVVMIVLSIFVPFLGPIFKVLVQILLLPLKLLLWLLKAVGKGIGALFKKIGQAISNRKRK